ncbi:unnamed protein product [Prorocentrum cordatum]|uniref:Uncharacterized protein n=1 Tax=Prorocentrum cordatum TaxID=2364126 RepID=A0ABN9TTK1_9DINO|nr:unnamed protein product [Polarella glacialis]
MADSAGAAEAGPAGAPATVELAAQEERWAELENQTAALQADRDRLARELEEARGRGPAVEQPADAQQQAAAREEAVAWKGRWEELKAQASALQADRDRLAREVEEAALRAPASAEAAGATERWVELENQAAVLQAPRGGAVSGGPATAFDGPSELVLMARLLGTAPGFRNSTFTALRVCMVLFHRMLRWSGLGGSVGERPVLTPRAVALSSLAKKKREASEKARAGRLFSNRFAGIK